MTRITFYLLSQQNREEFVCKLTEKAYKSQVPVFINAADAGHAQQINDQLWTFRQGSFIPHGLEADEDEHTPVVIGNGGKTGRDDGLMINLGADTPECFSRFERLAEVIDEAGKPAARERYKFYKDRGYEIETHKL